MNPRNRTLLYGLGCVVAGILSLLLVVMPIRLRMAESPGIAEVVTAVIASSAFQRTP
jgi:hypothetical protein